MVQFLKNVHAMKSIHFLESQWSDPAGQWLHSSDNIVHDSTNLKQIGRICMFKEIGAQPAIVHVLRVTNSTEFHSFIPNWH